MDKKQKIYYINMILIIGFFAAFIYNYIIMGVIFKIGFPHNTFLTDLGYSFTDFFDVMQWKQYILNDPSITPCYFPFSLIIINFFILIKPLYMSFYLFLLIFLMYFFSFAWKNLRMKDVGIQHNIYNVFIFTFLSYPVLFTIERGNFEVFVFIFLSLFFCFYIRNRYFISIIFLSMAIAMKATPAIFLVILIADKRIKEIIYTIIFTFLLSFIPLLIFDGSILENIRYLLFNLNEFKESYIINYRGMDYGHSLFCMIKAFPKVNAREMLMTYKIAVLAAFFLLSIYIIFFKIEFWKKVTLLTFAMLLFPYTSADYKLLHVFIPLVLFMNKTKEEENDLAYTVLFACLLIPKNYRFVKNYYIGIFMDPLLMLTIGIIIIKSKIKSIYYIKRQREIQLK